MTTATKEQKLADDKAATYTMENAHYFLERGGLLSVSITHTSQTNLSYRYSVKVYYPTERGIDSLYMNWAISQLTTIRQHKNGALKGSGCGFDRAFDVAETLNHIFTGLGLERIKNIRYEYSSLGE
jgi:hypothetical protein